ncbi:DUF1266 domain-containing protein [Microbacterium sp. MM2322]|uniref:DUF1266 domain-containing protein n=1 Tax=Microbacterium sp. MM2322 TaxID=3157631 RepID=UPI0032D56BA6
MADPVSTLQNHPGDVEYPVRARRKYGKMLEARRRANPSANGRRALLVTAIAAPFGIAAFSYSLDQFGSDDLVVNFLFFAFGMGIALSVIASAMTFVDAGAPRRAQKRYRQLTGIPAVTEHQQQVLALDAVSDFAIRGWNSSLAFTPTFAELPQAIRTKYNDGEKGSPWPAMSISSLRELRSSLDEQFRIVSASDAELLVADTLTLGWNSSRFAEVAESDGAAHMMSRIASLTGVAVFDIQDLAQSTDDRPARNLLAADIERAVGGVRYSYVVGYLTAEKAWELLELLAERAFSTYRSWDEYWRDVVIARAFRTDSLQSVQSQRDALAELRASAWPAASIAWPTVGAAQVDPA